VVAPATAVNALIDVRVATGGITNDFGGVLIDDASLSATTPGGSINVLSPTVQPGAVFLATMQTNGVTATVASGNVTFKTNTVVQSTGNVAGGSASSTPAILPAAYTVTAIYFRRRHPYNRQFSHPDGGRRSEHHADEHCHERFGQPAYALLAG